VTLSDFQTFVASQLGGFVGVHPISPADFDRFEASLGHQLPESLRWLLAEYGYSEFCGVGNLAEAVQETLDCRKSISLPVNWIILNNWGDAGALLLDLNTGRICWCGGHDVENVVAGQGDASAQWYADYPEWVVSEFRRWTR
jgi:SMI1-KNR4 cell-wall